MKAVPVLYLDLDGTVRKGYDELGKFVNTAQDVEVFPEAIKKIRQAKSEGWRIVGITNQGGIALGHLSMLEASEAIYETNRQCDGMFDKIMMCQHHPDATDPEFAFCWCRKPRIGNVVLAAEYMGRQHPGECYPPHMALFVGDRPEDSQCAENAGIPFMDAKEWRND